MYVCTLFLGRKLRRGDPFTEHATDWSPPDQRERAKRSIKKSATSGKVYTCTCESLSNTYLEYSTFISEEDTAEYY